jgi:hypothetical protein
METTVETNSRINARWCWDENSSWGINCEEAEAHIKYEARGKMDRLTLKVSRIADVSDVFLRFVE